MEICFIIKTDKKKCESKGSPGIEELLLVCLVSMWGVGGGGGEGAQMAVSLHFPRKVNFNLNISIS